MEIPVTQEWSDPEFLDLIFLFVNMGLVILGAGMVIFLITAIIVTHVLPGKSLKQSAWTIGLSLLVTGMVGGYYYTQFSDVEIRNSYEVITDESVNAQTEEVYGYTIIKQTDNEFPDEHEEVPDWWYMMKDPEGNERKCELVYSTLPKLGKVKGISAQTILLRKSPEAEAFRANDRTYSARLLCDGKEPARQ